MKQCSQGANPPGSSRSEAERQAIMKQYYSSQRISKILSNSKGYSGFIPMESAAAAESNHRRLKLFAEVRGIKICEPVTAEYLKSLLSCAASFYCVIDITIIYIAEILTCANNSTGSAVLFAMSWAKR